MNSNQGLCLTLIFFVVTFSNSFSQSKPKIEEAYDAYYNQKNWKEAANLFERLVQENPTHDDYIERLGFAHFNAGDNAESIHAFKHALSVAPWPDIYMYYIAANYVRLQKTDSALVWLEKSVKAGWPDYFRLADSRYFTSLHDEPAFKKLFGYQDIDTTNPRERWRADAEFVMNKLKLMHYDLYNKNPKDVWNSKYREVQKKIDNGSESEIIIELMQLAALAGEGHTKVLAPESGKYSFHSLPVEIYYFKYGFYIRKATKENKDLVGKEIVSIGGVPIKELFDKSYVYRGHENKMHHKNLSMDYLVMMETLKDMGAVQNIGSAVIEVRDEEGEIIDKKIESLTYEALESVPDEKWVAMNVNATKETPLYLRHSEKDFWFDHLDDANALYVHIQYILNNDETTFSAFVDSTFNYVEKNEIEKLVIDLRNCGGGNSEYNKYLIHRIIQNESINSEDNLFTIIGRETYSAAINLVSDFEYHTNTTFVGEPTGSSPNFIGESNGLMLPYSNLYLIISNRYHQGGANNSLDKRPWIAPDHLIEITSDAFRDNKDPVLDFILEFR